MLDTQDNSFPIHSHPLDGHVFHNSNDSDDSDMSYDFESNLQNDDYPNTIAERLRKANEENKTDKTENNKQNRKICFANYVREIRIVEDHPTKPNKIESKKYSNTNRLNEITNENGQFSTTREDDYREEVTFNDIQLNCTEDRIPLVTATDYFDENGNLVRTNEKTVENNKNMIQDGSASEIDTKKRVFGNDEENDDNSTSSVGVSNTLNYLKSLEQTTKTAEEQRQKIQSRIRRASLTNTTSPRVNLNNGDKSSSVETSSINDSISTSPRRKKKDTKRKKELIVKKDFSSTSSEDECTNRRPRTGKQRHTLPAQPERPKTRNPKMSLPETNSISSTDNQKLLRFENTEDIPNDLKKISTTTKEQPLNTQTTDKIVISSDVSDKDQSSDLEIMSISTPKLQDNIPNGKDTQDSSDDRLNNSTPVWKISRKDKKSPNEHSKSNSASKSKNRFINFNRDHTSPSVIKNLEIVRNKQESQRTMSRDKKLSVLEERMENDRLKREATHIQKELEIRKNQTKYSPLLPPDYRERLRKQKERQERERIERERQQEQTESIKKRNAEQCFKQWLERKEKKEKQKTPPSKNSKAYYHNSLSSSTGRNNFPGNKTLIYAKSYTDWLNEKNKQSQNEKFYHSVDTSSQRTKEQRTPQEISENLREYWRKKKLQQKSDSKRYKSNRKTDRLYFLQARQIRIPALTYLQHIRH
ncbi:hypothetical protein SNEBB_001745 [Seison nebaliae]|nr:hypothetical protein SNEBB_001745 [Seison nebaliae]